MPAAPDVAPDPTDQRGRGAASARTIALALVLDAVLVVVFAAVGRATHHDGVLGPGGSGLATTAWPFLAALALGWLVSLGWRRPTAPLRVGVPIWLVTVAGGMLLRALSGQATAVPFIVVATLTLLVLLVGWRLLAAMPWTRKRRPAPETRPTHPPDP